MSVALNNKESNIVDAYWNMLSPLSTKIKLQLAALLTTSVYEEESRKETLNSPNRIRSVRRRANDVPTDAQLEARFAGKEVPSFSEDPEWNEVINANTGKTIKPIEKWL